VPTSRPSRSTSVASTRTPGTKLQEAVLNLRDYFGEFPDVEAIARRTGLEWSMPEQPPLVLDGQLALDRLDGKLPLPPEDLLYDARGRSGAASRVDGTLASRSDQPRTGDVCGDAARVSRQQRPAADRSVRADQEVGEHGGARATGTAIGRVSMSGEKRAGDGDVLDHRHRRQSGSQRFQP
jgi:hypothetical protein